MIQHPETNIPEDRLRKAYADLLLTLARDEPEALVRAATTLVGDGIHLPAALPGESPGAQLALAYLAFTGHPAMTVPAEGMQVFTFSYPAHVVFQLTGAGGPRAARRIARRSVGALVESDEPLIGLHGPLPTEPRISNLVVWLGSPSGEKDVLELEGID